MKAGWLIPLLVAASFAGCTAGEAPNPHLLSPKVVLQARPDGNLTVYVHSAFGERAYDWLSLRVDNVTVANRTDAFSLEETVPGDSHFLEVTTGTSTQVYVMRARVDVEPDGERAQVSFLDDEGAWSDAKPFTLPFEHILEREEADG